VERRKKGGEYWNGEQSDNESLTTPSRKGGFSSTTFEMLQFHHRVYKNELPCKFD
jgi:hypothetical protein